jgi:hypothetical protein
MAGAIGVISQISMTAAGTTTPVAFRLVSIDSSGYAAYPNASSDDDALATFGVTTDNPGVDALVPVAGLNTAGTRKVTIAASQTVAIGDPLYMVGTVGCVQTGLSGWLVGYAREAATSAAGDLAIIEAITFKPISVSAGT